MFQANIDSVTETQSTVKLRFVGVDASQMSSRTLYVEYIVYIERRKLHVQKTMAIVQALHVREARFRPSMFMLVRVSLRANLAHV